MSPKAATAQTRILDAALTVIRKKGYSATTVDDLCEEAGVTKGAFFHHFKSKEDLAIQAARHWSAVTGALFERADFHKPADPLERVLAYVEFRRKLLQGPEAAYTCLAGTMVQETFESNPAIRDACRASIFDHAATLAGDIEEARKRYAPDATWTAQCLALHTQAVIQGSFILAKSGADSHFAADTIDHLRRYIELLFNRRNAPSQPRKEASA